jgi:hypothetical protein
MVFFLSRLERQGIVKIRARSSWKRERAREKERERGERERKREEREERERERGEIEQRINYVCLPPAVCSCLSLTIEHSCIRQSLFLTVVIAPPPPD